MRQYIFNDALSREKMWEVENSVNSPPKTLTSDSRNGNHLGLHTGRVTSLRLLLKQLFIRSILASLNLTLSSWMFAWWR